MAQLFEKARLSVLSTLSRLNMNNDTNGLSSSAADKAFVPFKRAHSKEVRLAEAARIRSKYPDRIPIIVERNPQSKSGVPNIDKRKFLCPVSISFGQFAFVIRKRIKLRSEVALFTFVGETHTLPSSDTLLSQIYKEHKDKEDSFLYVTYDTENQFG
jgi:GABA(A) receptor-associated protein